MPLVRIDMLKGKSEQYRSQVGEIVYRTLLDVLNQSKQVNEPPPLRGGPAKPVSHLLRKAGCDHSGE